MTGVGKLPQNNATIPSSDAKRMSNWNIRVTLPMDEQDGDLSRCHRLFWRYPLHIQPVSKPRVCERDIDNRAKNDATNPGTCMKVLTHSIIGSLSESGEG